MSKKKVVKAKKRDVADLSNAKLNFGMESAVKAKSLKLDEDALNASNPFIMELTCRATSKLDTITYSLNGRKIVKDKGAIVKLDIRQLDFIKKEVGEFMAFIMPKANSAYPRVLGPSYGGQLSVNSTMVNAGNSFKNMVGYQNGVIFLTNNPKFNRVKVVETCLSEGAIIAVNDASYTSFEPTNANIKVLKAVLPKYIK